MMRYIYKYNDSYCDTILPVHVTFVFFVPILVMVGVCLFCLCLLKICLSELVYVYYSVV